VLVFGYECVCDHFEAIVLKVTWYLSENITICDMQLQE
jgi:hypothetical protein